MTNLNGPSAEDMRMFLQEAEEQIQLLDEDIIRIEKEADDVELLQEIFRAAHTLKGSSSMIGFHAMAQLTHAMEDILDRVRKRSLTVTPELVDALLQGLDGLKQLREGFAQGGDVSLDVSTLVDAMLDAADGPGDATQAEAGGSLEGAVASDPKVRTSAEAALAKGLAVYRVSATLLPACEWPAVRGFQILAQLGSLGEVLFSFPSAADIEREQMQRELHALFATATKQEAIQSAISGIEDVEKASLEPWTSRPASETSQSGSMDEDVFSALRSATSQAELGGPKLEVRQTVRIAVETLDSLMNVVGELVIDPTRVSQISRNLSARYREDETVGELATTTTHMSKVVEDLNERMMKARMLPVGLLFNKFPRMVRDLARSLAKDVDFVIEGADTELDRSVIERIQDPLLHLLRNAVDHGIEKSEDRTAAGKPAAARIRLAAHHEQGHIYITISDDGQGIDARRVRAAAVQRALMSAEAVERLSEAEALELIFEPGISTASATTEVSGRGVGMDVVQKSITDLGGLITFDTALGKGTIFTLRLPLTLATFRGLLVSVQGTAYAIPLSYVQETVMLEREAIQRVMGNEVLNLRDRAMPLLRLNSQTLVARNEGSGSDGKFVVVLRSDSKLLALAVDDLLDQQDVVVKPIMRLASGNRGISGASILGDGRVALILDIASLMRSSVLGASSLVELERTFA